MKRLLTLLLAFVLMFSLLPLDVLAVEEVHAHAANPFVGKKVSILSHSQSTYAGVSNDSGANSTIGSNDVYFTEAHRRKRI